MRFGYLLLILFLSCTSGSKGIIHGEDTSAVFTAAPIALLPADTMFAAADGPAGGYTLEEALALLRALPEVKQDNAYIDSLSHHKHGVAMIDYSEGQISDLPYYKIHVGYNSDLRFETYRTYRVNKKDGNISVEDEYNEPIPLAIWQKQHSIKVIDSVNTVATSSSQAICQLPYDLDELAALCNITSVTYNERACKSRYPSYNISDNKQLESSLAGRFDDLLGQYTILQPNSEVSIYLYHTLGDVEKYYIITLGSHSIIAIKNIGLISDEGNTIFRINKDYSIDLYKKLNANTPREFKKRLKITKEGYIQ